MKIHSLKLTIQDVPSKEGRPVATVFGTLTLDTEELAKDEKGETRVDSEGVVVPILDDINFVLPVNSSPELKAVVQSLAVQALTLKDMEIAKKNGQLSHYVETVQGVAPEPKKGPGAIPKPRRKKK